MKKRKKTKKLFRADTRTILERLEARLQDISRSQVNITLSRSRSQDNITLSRSQVNITLSRSRSQVINITSLRSQVNITLLHRLLLLY